MTKYDWIYNRVKLSSKFNPYLIIDLSKKIPEKYPVYIRNVDTRVPYLEIANTQEDLPSEDGYVAQKIIHGEKIYYDFTFSDYEIIDSNILLEKDNDITKVEQRSIAIEMAAESLNLKNGKVTIETIAGVIFRISLNQF